MLRGIVLPVAAGLAAAYLTWSLGLAAVMAVAEVIA